MNDESKKNKSEIIFVELSELKQCLDLNRQYRGNSMVCVQRLDGKQALNLYGSVRLDKINGRDNILKIKRNRVEQFVGNQETT
jgi:hypothetical protein